jgi:hypothetical protein
MPRFAAVCKLTATSRGKRNQDGECDFNKALSTPSKHSERCKYTRCLNKDCGICMCVDCLSKVAEALRSHLESHPGTKFVHHKVWDVLLRNVFTSGAAHESDVDVFRPREGGGGDWVQCCPICIDQTLPETVMATRLGPPPTDSCATNTRVPTPASMQPVTFDSHRLPPPSSRFETSRRFGWRGR